MMNTELEKIVMGISISTLKLVWMQMHYLQLGGTKKNTHPRHFGAAQLKELFGEKNFDFPKAKGLVKNAILACTGKDKGKKVVLDFFAGSGTTAHAVNDIRREINPDMRFIIVDQGSILKP